LDPELLARIAGHPKYRALVARRTRLAWLLTALMLVAYFGYIGLIAFNKGVLARPIGSGVTSLGIPVGVGLIVFTVALTAVYVVHANTTFDRLTREIIEETAA
jgi:uncharacterized membrane protein (DUF485 family)